eukprot:TRINITY_DN1090_c0_g1_i1.p1 TRINITY_DN1090_c0_g1~~TRINITY_DN1090_c0_g1_i1.p1  ORF type:complete len:520 (+),score=61.44 TRINITY_DN1090_c0_g1_i1:109-1668(+)
MALRICIFIAFFFYVLQALDNGLGRTPAMGYNSWYDLTCSSAMNEDVIKQTADAMVSTGLAKLGYQYINMDDCWAEGRYNNGTVYPDFTKFKSGIKALADYIHSKGLKFGVYTDRGNLTCGGRPGALGHEKIDAETYASWGVDYVKEDSCYASGDHDIAFEEYGRMRDALNATGRPIYFSLCGWSSWYAPKGWDLGNSWRIGPDDTNWAGILQNIDIDASLAEYASPGGWNDPCLLLGKTYDNTPRVTELQSRFQFNMWSILSAPLLISANIRNLSPYDLETYSNSEVIAVNQDPLGKQGIRLAGGPLSNGGAHLKTCDGSAWQKWDLDTPMAGFVYNKETKLCLNVDDCGTDLIYYSCVTSGGTCAGSNSYANEQFKFNGNGQFVSALNSKCVTTRTDNLFLDTCNTSDISQKWEYSNGEIKTNGLCLSTLGNPTNVWGRSLHDGSWAVLFINIGLTDIDVTCDSDCFKQMGFTAGSVINIRDLWKHEDIGTISTLSYTVNKVPVEGGSVMLKFTQQK